MRKEAPLAVERPAPGADNPAWVKVGVIAAIGFVVGVAWPRVFNVRLGPSAPGEASAASASASAKGRAAEAPPASVAARASAAGPASPAAASASAASIGASTVAAPSGPPQIHVPKGAVISCKTDEGETKKGKECGPTASLDMLVGTRLKKLASCSAAEGQTGKLSFMVTADFASSRLTWDVGKSSTVGNLDGLGTCLKTHFQGVSTAGVLHDHPRYTVAYTATFSPPPEAALPKEKVDKNEPLSDKASDKASDKNAKDEKPSASEKPEAPAAGAEATVAWEVALVRDVPKTGSVVVRLPRGTKVKIGQVKDGWYAIKYGEGFANDGWVYRGAIGR